MRRGEVTPSGEIRRLLRSRPAGARHIPTGRPSAPSGRPGVPGAVAGFAARAPAGTVRHVDYGSPGSYLTLAAGTDVIASDDERVGKVEHVLADADADVFDGLVIDISAGPGGLRFADADEVAEIYEHAVVLTLPAAAVAELPKPAPAPAALESHGGDDADGPLQSKLRRAWDLISGNY